LKNLYINVFTAIEINFSQPMYSVDEDNGVVEIQLIFSNPSSIDMTIKVNSEEINATSKFKLSIHLKTYLQMYFIIINLYYNYTYIISKTELYIANYLYVCFQ